MKLETPVKPGMDALHTASRISVDVGNSSLCWSSPAPPLSALGWLSRERRDAVWRSCGCFCLETVRDDGGVLSAGWDGVRLDLSLSPSAEGQERNGGVLGRPWELKPKAWVFHVTLFFIPLNINGQIKETKVET